MANQTVPQLYGDPAKINYAGAEESDINEYQKSLEEQVKALEMRYQNPNWFKVAAGFLKPQLGGFSASLGSASEALGENLEAGRAAQLPVAQMRAQLYASKIAMGQNKKVADMVDKYEASGKPLTPEFVAKMTRISPNAPATQSLQSQLKTQMEQQQLATTTQGQALQRVQLARSIPGYKPTAEDMRILQGIGGNAPSPSTTPSGLPSANIPSELSNTKSETPLPVKFKHPTANLEETNDELRSRLAEADAEWRRTHNGQPLPITSGARTREEQQSLYENRNKPGIHMPINPADFPEQDKFHIDAVDISGRVPDEFLRNFGLHRPLGKKDPVHVTVDPNWISSGEKPGFADLGASEIGAVNLTEEQLKAMNTRYAPQANRVSYFDPNITNDSKARLVRLSELLDTPGVQKGTGLLYQDEGVMAAIKAGLAQGASGSFGTPAGGANFNFFLPIETISSKLKLKPTEQNDLREFQQILSVEGRNDLTAAMQAMGGGHMNMAEFNSAMNSILSGSDPYDVLKKHVKVRLLENERNARLYDSWGDFQTDPKMSSKPIAYFFHDKNGPYRRIMDEYSKQISQARRK